MFIDLHQNECVVRVVRCKKRHQRVRGTQQRQVLGATFCSYLLFPNIDNVANLVVRFFTMRVNRDFLEISVDQRFLGNRKGPFGIYEMLWNNITTYRHTLFPERAFNFLLDTLRMTTDTVKETPVRWSANYLSKNNQKYVHTHTNTPTHTPTHTHKTYHSYEYFPVRGILK